MYHGLKLLKKIYKFNLRRVKLSPHLFFGLVLVLGTLVSVATAKKPPPPRIPEVKAAQVSKFNLATPTPNLIPKDKGVPLPAVSSRHVFIMDRETKAVLFQDSADESVPPASTTKIMTALVALKKFSLNETFRVTRAYPTGQVIGFEPGEELTVEQLVYALLVQSGNDAAEILAENYPGGRVAFVQAMNAKAAALNLLHTRFLNPTGLDEPGHFSSASDLARLADIAMDDTEFARIVGTENAVVSDHVLTNVNELLGRVPGVLGIKTGYTEEAGQALVTLVNQQNHPVILVVLKSTDRFQDTEKLISWVYSNFTWPIPE